MVRGFIFLMIFGLMGCLTFVGKGPWNGTGGEPVLEQTILQTDYFTVQKLIRIKNPFDEKIIVVFDCGSKEEFVKIEGHSLMDITWNLDIVDNRCSISSWNFI